MFYLQLWQSTPWFCHRRRRIRLHLPVLDRLNEQMIEEQIFSRFFHLSEPNHHHRSTLWCLFRPTGNQDKSKDWWFCDYQNINVANLSSSGDDFPNSMWIRVKDFSLQRIKYKWILSIFLFSSSLENVESSDQHCQAVCQCLEGTPGIL